MRYWLNRGTQPEGPHDESAVVAMIGAGLRHANVCPEGAGSWQPIASIPVFGAALARAAAPGPSSSAPAAGLVCESTSASHAGTAIEVAACHWPAPGAPPLSHRVVTSRSRVLHIACTSTPGPAGGAAASAFAT